MKKRVQFNVRLDEDQMKQLEDKVKSFNEQHKITLTVSGLIKKIIREYLDNDIINREDKDENL